MREIKFRAWDINNKHWVQLDERVKIANGTVEGQVWSFIICFSPDGEMVMHSGDIGYAISQYTGLKDKNGKEGYFDDLVKWGKSIYQIIWDDYGGAAWLDKVSGEETWKRFRIHLIREGEIIGNIYENPELLKG